jgi:hypothetical protein
MRILISSNTFGRDQEFHPMGTILDMKEVSEGKLSASDKELCGHLLAAGRIMEVNPPAVAEVIKRCQKAKQPVPEDLADAADELGVKWTPLKTAAKTDKDKPE